MATTQAQTPAAAGRTGESPGISRGLVTLFAVTAGLSAANIYYAQPLLTSIAAHFHVGSAAASWVATAGPVGYVVGLAFLVPLGDMVNRRRLVVGMLAAVAAAQVVAAVAPSLGLLIAAEVVAAVVSTVSPLMVSFAANLALPQQRGKVTGSVMSGVLIGILLARTAGGILSQFAGWRAVYAAAAAVVAVLAVTLARILPQTQASIEQRLGYFRLLGSAVTLLREEPVLRLRTAYGFFALASFQTLWTSLAFLLAKPPYSYGNGLIGVFGFAGLLGAIGARGSGRLADGGRERLASGLLPCCVLVSWGLMDLGHGGHLVPLVIGIAGLDFGVQGMQVMNLSIVYRLRPAARSRLTTAYMTLYLAGAVAGSAASGWAYAAHGWDGVAAVGAGFGAVALLLWFVAEVVFRMSAPSDAEALAAAASTTGSGS